MLAQNVLLLAALSKAVFAHYSYTDAAALAFVGSQHWNESGWYADSGLKKHYDGYFCLCGCNATDEGIFCSGAGVHADGKTMVAKFLGVFSEEGDGKRYVGDLIAFNTSKPFTDHFTLNEPGGPANYTGISQSLGSKSFVWRGYMGGVDCNVRDKCALACQGKPQYEQWSKSCGSFS